MIFGKQLAKGSLRNNFIFYARPLQNAPFCSISASGLNFNPRNTQCIPVVKIFAFLELKQKLTFFKGLYAPMHPVWQRCENSEYPDIPAPLQLASRALQRLKIANVFLREP
jgi:hypothetical protein